MDLYFEIAGNQIDGARDYQEDAFLTTYIDDEAGEPKSSSLVIMADGMGGHAAGNIASNLVVSTFNKSFTGNFGSKDTPSVLRDSLLKANDALQASIRETPALDGMGCTMVSAAFSGGRLWWASVGDSHLYLIRGGELRKENEDHSYGGYLDRMKAEGVEPEGESGLSRNMLMSAMTGDEIAEIDCPDEPLDLQSGDRVIIASDGLDTLSSAEILRLSKHAVTPKECVDALLKAVEAAAKPRQDNTTVVVVDVLERAAPARHEAPQPAAAPGEIDRIGETQPVAAAEISAAAAEAPAEAAPRRAGGSRGLLLGGAALALIALAAGAYFLLGRGEPGPAPLATAPVPEAPAPAPASGTPAPAAEAPAAEAPAAEAPEQPPAPGAAAPQSEAAPAAPAAQAREFRDALKSGGEGPLLVEIPGGSFEMGSSKLSVKSDERPPHQVQVAPFAMSRYEVTYAEYARFARATGRALPDDLGLAHDTYPVLFVSWDDAYAYTRWLSAQTGQRYRLPSEAEWEYAAAGGADTPYWWGLEMKPDMAHCFGCGTGLDPRRPTTVGRFPPNPFGLYDMTGNVMEWVHDCYHANYQGAPQDGSVWEGGDCTYRVVRGGAYSSPPPSLRSSARDKRRANSGYDTVGIRLVREL